jgi:LemA protein
MTPELIVPLLFVTIVPTAWSIGTYNKFVKYKNNIEASWSGIDVALKRRATLIPGLVDVIEGYGKHETALFKAKTDSYNSAGASDRVAEESHMSRSLGGLLALAEAYPELKASDNFLNLQQRLNDIETEIVQARNQFNRNVARLNTLVESFPAKLIAKRFGFTRQNYLDLELATRDTMPEVEISTSSGPTGG